MRPEGDALGARLRLSSNVDTVWRRVVGIVGDVRSRGLEAEPRQEFYFPHAQYPTSPAANATATMSFVLDAPGQSPGLAAAVRAAVARIDPGVPVAQVRTMDQVLETTLSGART